jgi:preprotein translocase subunit SecY
MNKFFTTIRNIFAIEDLRTRIFNTLGFLIIFRLGAHIVLPATDPNLLGEGAQEGILSLLNTILGGAFSKAAIFALGIMPYISASIVVQLLTVAVPYFTKLQKEGESGRKKINQITRVLTIAITLVQGFSYLQSGIIPTEAIMIDPFWWTITNMIVLTSGTMFVMWLGERITDKGIGNGISMLIMIGIISVLPGALWAEALTRGGSQLLFFIIELVALFFVVMAVVMLTQATRQIPIQYAKQVIGGKVYGGQRQYIPLKINAAGVMPIIFAQSLMFLPGLVAGFWADQSDLASSIGRTFSSYTSWEYNLVFAILIIVFTFFYTAITVNPNQISDDLKRNGGFVPGIKPGRDTSHFIDSVLTRITLPGSIFLAIVAILPALAVQAGVNQQFAQFFGGTSLLIMVGVILDTLNQINSYLLMRHYEGMMKSGKIRGKSENVAVA